MAAVAPPDSSAGPDALIDWPRLSGRRATIDPVPDGYAIVRGGVERDTRTVLRQASQFFWPVAQGGALACRRLQMQRGALVTDPYPDAAGAAVRERFRLGVQHRDVTLERSSGAGSDGATTDADDASRQTVRWTSLSLDGPAIERAARAPNTGAPPALRCVETFTVVDVYSDRLVIVPAEAAVRSYAPNAAESWFFTRAACESAIRQPGVVVASRCASRPGGG